MMAIVMGITLAFGTVNTGGSAAASAADTGSAITRTGHHGQTTFVIRGDRWLGPVRVAQASLGEAIAAFGDPVITQKPRAIECTARWRALGLVIVFADFQATPCRTRSAFFYSATVTGAVWRTDRGLRVGDSVSTLRRLYPKARLRGAMGPYPARFPSGWWLISRVYINDCARTPPVRYPSLLATASGNRVAAFRVRHVVCE